jgi:hypothetical protein
VSRRFHTLFFLATPHRGADSATMLSNILRASMTNSPRGFISDLEPNSAAIEGINESFRHNYHGTRIWSFYETVPSFPNTNELVVEKHSSTLGVYATFSVMEYRCTVAYYKSLTGDICSPRLCRGTLDSIEHRSPGCLQVREFIGSRLHAHFRCSCDHSQGNSRRASVFPPFPKVLC